MKVNLYQNFEHLKKYNNIWLYSDPHFGDKELASYRHISDDEQVKSINAVVGKKDVIIFLGDIGDTQYITKIKGYKILILGNHDVGATRYKRQSVLTETGELIDNKLFDEVYPGVVTLSNKIILSHKPINIPFMLNIHGHCHQQGKNDSCHLNVCAEHINYTPVNLVSIIKAGILKNIVDINRVTIDNAIKKSKN